MVKSVWEMLRQWGHHLGKGKVGSSLTHRKKKIKDLNVKSEIVEVLEDTMRIFLSISEYEESLCKP